MCRRQQSRNVESNQANSSDIKRASSTVTESRIFTPSAILNGDVTMSRASSVRTIPWMRRTFSIASSRGQPPAYEDIDAFVPTAEHRPENIESIQTKELELPYIIPLTTNRSGGGVPDPVVAVYAKKLERHGIPVAVWMQFLQDLDQIDEDEIDVIAMMLQDQDVGSTTSRSGSEHDSVLSSTASKSHIDAVNRDFFHPALLHIELAEGGSLRTRLGLSSAIEAAKNAELAKIASELLKKNSKLERKMHARIEAGKPQKAAKKYIEKKEKAERKANEKTLNVEAKALEEAAKAGLVKARIRQPALTTGVESPGKARWLVVSRLQETPSSR